MKTQLTRQHLSALTGLSFGLAGLMLLSHPPSAHAQNPPDLASTFATDAENWRATSANTNLTWQSSGGSPGGYLEGKGTNALWYFVSPPTWAGDWRSYRTLKFDLAITSRHYADVERTNLVVIVGTNGAQMSWTADAPLFTWTHYEVSLLPGSFGVSQTTFDSIMAGVAELRLLGEYTLSSETLGLDNVVVTSATPPVQPTNLVSRFTFGTDDWRPVDDVTLSHRDEGWPTGSLYADDWMDGRTYKIATPLSWAGDWRRFRYLQFDMNWSGQGALVTNVEVVRILGANGQTISWTGDVTNGVWQHRDIALTPSAFGVDAAKFDGVMSQVSQMWIVGEFGSGDDRTQLDNVVLAESRPTPYRFTTNLVSRFHADAEGWAEIDNGTLFWDTNGFSGGALNLTDAGSGAMKFHSPDAWAGDWRNFKQLRFMLRSLNRDRATYDSEIWIMTWDGTALYATNPPPYWSWTPYTISLTPATFGVTQGEFDRVMSDVACLLIGADLVSGTDTTALDNVMLMTDDAPGIAAARSSSFNEGIEAWRVGDVSADWIFTSRSPDFLATDDNPGGCIANSDWTSTTLWFSPESWAGDWRGLQGISFDFKILSGTSLVDDTWMLSVVSAQGNLDAYLPAKPRPGQWEHYDFAFNPATFNVSTQTFDKIIRDVVMVAIRSEWIIGAERELLDNVLLAKTPDPYDDWIDDFFAGDDLADPSKVGPQADPDGDGANNWSEYVAGTVPTNRLDFLRIERITPPPAVTIGFRSVTNRIYALESRSSLAAAPWALVPGQSNILGSGGWMALPDTNVVSSPRFYRLKVNLP